jgi:hypothetical protein
MPKRKCRVKLSAYLYIHTAYPGPGRGREGGQPQGPDVSVVRTCCLKATGGLRTSAFFRKPVSVPRDFIRVFLLYFFWLEV